jgi:hypothetical protein
MDDVMIPPNLLYYVAFIHSQFIVSHSPPIHLFTYYTPHMYLHVFHIHIPSHAAASVGGRADDFQPIEGAGGAGGAGGGGLF